MNIEPLEYRTRPHRYAKRCGRVTVTTIEPLEVRVAPATFTYADVDGYFVTIKTSKGTDPQLAAIITPFLVVEGLGMELQEIDFSAGAATFAGSTLSVMAKRTTAGGDGLVNVGYIDATDTDGGNALDVGVVTIKGDLGRINAGDGTTTTAGLKGLSVQSIGLFGGTTQASGGSLISAINGAIGFLKVFGTVKESRIGAVGVADGKIGSVAIGGSLLGGGGDFSGQIVSDSSMGPVKIGGSIEGGSAQFSGVISAGGAIASVTVGGSLLGRSADSSGQILSGGAIGPVRISGNIEGGDLNVPGGLTNTGRIFAHRIASLFVGGSIIAGTKNALGTLESSGSVRVINDIGPIVIKGSLIGNATNPVIITAGGRETPTATTDVAIKSLSVAGRVEFANVLAGYSALLTITGENPDAQIGPVKVGGDWIASSLVAGAQDDATPEHDSFFGDADDQAIAAGNPTIISKIASILIKGTALGTLGTGNHFGFVAEQIGSFKVGTTKFTLTAGPSNDTTGLAVGITGDLRVREV
jgi:hypothetical protein